MKSPDKIKMVILEFCNETFAPFWPLSPEPEITNNEWHRADGKVIAPEATTRPEPTNLSAEPPYPDHETVLFAMNGDGSLTHHPKAAKCSIEYPHKIADCAEFQSVVPGEAPKEKSDGSITSLAAEHSNSAGDVSLHSGRVGGEAVGTPNEQNQPLTCDHCGNRLFDGHFDRICHKPGCDDAELREKISELESQVVELTQSLTKWREFANYGTSDEIDTPEKLGKYLEVLITEEETNSELRSSVERLEKELKEARK